jgi:peptidoglycan/LPS O-acetylase OafA/YrhL
MTTTTGIATPHFVSGGSGRISGMDGVRGLATIMVLLFHFSAISAVDSSSTPDLWLTRFAEAWWWGVELFFVLSGFLITGILMDAKESNAPFFRTFYARRFLRIIPAYYALLVLLIFILPNIDELEPGRIASMRENQWWYWGYVHNLLITFDGGQRPDLIETWHLWSLAIEEQFYIVWPAVVLFFSARALPWVCVACIAGSCVLRVAMRIDDVPPDVVHTLTLARMDSLAFGGLLAIVARSPYYFRMFTRWAPHAALASALVLAVIIVPERKFSPFDPDVQTFGLFFITILSGALLLMAGTAPRGSRVHGFLDSTIPRAIGSKYSYGMYLIHWPIAVYLFRNFDLVDAMPEVGGTRLLGRMLLIGVAFALSFAVAYPTWHFFEKQWLKFKDRFPYHLPPERDPHPPPPLAVDADGTLTTDGGLTTEAQRR